jgi:hypothetical protein
MTNTEAAEILTDVRDNSGCWVAKVKEAFSKAITALEHQPEPVCHWRTLDTTRTLCDSCGSFELAPVSDIGRKAGA